MNNSKKEFVLRFDFKKAWLMKKTEHYTSEEEDHFGITWWLRVTRDDQFLYVNLGKSGTGSTNFHGNFNVRVESDHGVISENFKFSGSKSDAEMQPSTSDRCESFKWNKLDYSKYLSIEGHVEIIDMTGYHDFQKRVDFGSDVTRRFADTVLIVRGQRFYVLKQHLALHSPYFKNLLKECTLDSEIQLPDVDTDDFQKYLEILYGFSTIDDNFVEGIHLLGQFFETERIITACETFLIYKSKKSIRKLFEFSNKFHLKKLNKNCVENIKSSTDLRLMLPPDVLSIHHTAIVELFRRSMQFH